MTSYVNHTDKMHKHKNKLRPAIIVDNAINKEHVTI